MAGPLPVLTAQNAVALAQNVMVVALSAAAARTAEAALNAEVVLSVAADQIALAARTAVQDAQAARILEKARAVPGARSVAQYPLAFEWADLKQLAAAEPAPRRFFDLADRPGRFARDDPAGHASQANLLHSGPRASWSSADAAPLARLDYFLPVVAG